MLLEVKSPPKHVEIPKSTEITEIRKSKIENPKKNRPIKKNRKTHTHKQKKTPKIQGAKVATPKGTQD
jgi:hypothetical protein